jgi:flagellar biosynthesis/type III secretory pathway protein FliH
MSNTEDLGELITRRDQLKINTSTDQQRHELAQVVGKITQHLHEPFRIEADRLREMRQEIAQEITTAQYQRLQLRCRLGHAQGQRSTTLAAGDDPGEHLDLSKRLSVELHDLEERIGHLEARIRGIEAQEVDLTLIEADSIRSGVSAS